MRPMKLSVRQKVQAFIRISLIKLKKGRFSAGNNVYIGRGSSISPIYELVLGNDIYIGKNVTIEVEGEIGSGCLIANNVGIIGRRDHDIDYKGKIYFADTVWENRDLSLKTIIEDGVWIGYGSIIMSGLRIGENSVIAAGSVVTKNVEKNTIVAGNPAKRIRTRWK